MSSFNLNDLDNRDYYKNFSYLPDNDKDVNVDNLMTQSLIIHQPFRRIRHPELTPIIINKDRNDKERTMELMSQSLIVPPFRRIRHVELTPVIPKEKENKFNLDSSKKSNFPKRAFSMTRLDQLAKPRQRYLEEALKLRASVTKENLISQVRPTSSMSLASKQVVQTNNNNNASIHYRQRVSARKPRPISYAGSTFDQLQQSTLYEKSVSSEKFSKSFSREKVPNANTNRSSNSTISRQLNSSNNESLSVNVSFTKPTPPRKPAHVKAAVAARKLTKNDPVEKIKKSTSSPKLNSDLVCVNGDKMKKSVTNPEKITEILEEEKIEINNIMIAKTEIKYDQSEKIYIYNDSVKDQLLLVDESRIDKKQCLEIVDLDKVENIIEKEINMEDNEKVVIEEESRKAFEEERKRIAQEEERKRIAREELDKKTKEKAEKARLEMEERLRKDEEERNARRKRLEAIMSRTRKAQNNIKSDSPNYENTQAPDQVQQNTQDFVDNVNNKLVIEQIEINEKKKIVELNNKIKPDVVEDAIKSNLINGKLTNNENLNNCMKNENNEMVNYLENDNLMESKSRLINSFKELKMSASSTFVFTAQTSNETFTPGAN